MRKPRPKHAPLLSGRKRNGWRQRRLRETPKQPPNERRRKRSWRRPRRSGARTRGGRSPCCGGDGSRQAPPQTGSGGESCRGSQCRGREGCPGAGGSGSESRSGSEGCGQGSRCGRASGQGTRCRRGARRRRTRGARSHRSREARAAAERAATEANAAAVVPGALLPRCRPTRQQTTTPYQTIRLRRFFKATRRQGAEQETASEVAPAPAAQETRRKARRDDWKKNYIFGGGFGGRGACPSPVCVSCAPRHRGEARRTNGAVVTVCANSDRFR